MPKEDKKYNKSYNIKQADISEGHTEIIANEENQFELFFEEILYQSK
jgi:hypothetical protein